MTDQIPNPQLSGSSEGRTVRPSKLGICWSFGGGVLGSVSWILVFAYYVADWLVAGLVLLAALGTFAISTTICLRRSDRYYRIAAYVIVAMAAINLLVVNLRYTKWVSLHPLAPHYRPSPEIPVWQMNLMLAGLFAALLLAVLYFTRKQKAARQNRHRQAAARPS